MDIITTNEATQEQHEKLEDDNNNEETGETKKIENNRPEKLHRQSSRDYKTQKLKTPKIS